MRYLFLIVSWLLAKGPQWLRFAIGDAIGILWFDVLRIRRKVALDNLRLAFPTLSEAKRISIARNSLKNMGKALVEFSLFPFYEPQQLEHYFEVDGLEHLEKALKRGKGVLFLSLHLGSGDFATAAVSRMGYKLNLISKVFKSGWLNDFWFEIRAGHGTKFISVEKSSFDILRALKRNEIVVFVLDQFMGPPIGVRTRFFGHETGTAMGLALMHLRTGAPLLPSYTYRNSNGKSVIVFESEIPLPDLGPAPSLDAKERSIATLTQVYTDRLEKIIAAHPSQWMWIHRRWKPFVE